MTRDILYQLITDPVKYLETLRERDMFDNILPEIGELVKLEQTNRYHTEDAYTHILNVIKALPDGVSKECRLAAVFHDIGKAVTRTFNEEENVYHFYAHEKKSVSLFEDVCERFGWTSENFDISRVIWLINNHLKLHTQIRDSRKAKRNIEKRFFRGDIPYDYRRDLLALHLADTLGSVPVDEDIRDAKTAHHRLLEKLFWEVEEELKEKTKSLNT